MSTPERDGIDVIALPAEARLPAGHAPQPTSALTAPSNAPTPGAALAGARVPGAPTLPEWDPVSMASLIGRLANEYFQAPPTANLPSPATAASTGVAPGDPGVPTTLPSASAPEGLSPLAPPQSLAVPEQPSLGGGHPSPAAAPSFSVPLLDEPEAAAVVPVAPASPAIPGIGAAPSLTSPFSAAPNFDALLVAPTQPAIPAQVPPVDERSAQPALPAYEVSPTAHGYRHAGVTPFDPHALRKQFPILEERVNGRRLVWLDNAATTQKPQAVIDRLSRFYQRENSNIHRAAHTLAARATDAYETARETVRRFLNAPSPKDIIFVRGATEGINLIAKSWGQRNVQEGDELVITWLEHHANIVPWQQLCAEKKAVLRVAPVDDTGQVILEEYEKLLGPKTRLVSVTQVSNALGTVTPTKELVALAHRHGAKVLVDGAQAVSHLRVDVQELDCDFYVFSGHKVFAPTGIGAVFGRSELLDETPPWQGGGNMIQDVTFERTTFHPSPQRFEAGTGNIADAVGLGAALDWLTQVGIENVARYEHELLEYATPRLLAVPGLRLYGTAPGKAGVLSFTLAGQKTEQVGGLLDREGIAVRSGHHCAQPILRRLGVEATVRASLAPYNTCEDIDELVAALLRLQGGR